MIAPAHDPSLLYVLAVIAAVVVIAWCIRHF